MFRTNLDCKYGEIDLDNNNAISVKGTEAF